MNENKLIIKPKKYQGETAVVSARLPNDLIKALDKLAEDTGRTRNEIIQRCLEFSVENVAIKNERDDNNG